MIGLIPPTHRSAGTALLLGCAACTGCDSSRHSRTEFDQASAHTYHVATTAEPPKLVNRTESLLLEEKSALESEVSPQDIERSVRSTANVPTPASTRPPLFAVHTADSVAYGVPIGLFADQTLLMRKDGAIQSISNDRIQKQMVLLERFYPISRKELTQQLQAEFGKRYSIKQNSSYLVVADASNLDKWIQRFRSLEHSVQLYCATHSIPVREIEFPLVAIVFSSREEFDRYAAREETTLPENCVGYYSQKTNRIVLYESDQSIAHDTLETICHEATHQLAFNIGLHQRLAATPLWLAEGFATMFESPKLSGLQIRDDKSLWPAARRNEWEILAKRPDLVHRLVDDMIRNDEPFKSETLQAYCVSWAMALYLSQRRPQQFSDYLESISNLPPFEAYEANQRATDFQAAFGNNSRLFTNSMMKFINSLE